MRVCRSKVSTTINPNKLAKQGEGTLRIQATLIQLIVLFTMATAFGSQSRTSPLAIGEMAPDFTLADQSGQSVTLSAARGKSPVVLVFYRGYW
jgi:cytochrome oxidase Cu insertion factor (SCO1/SenC/PrrC family)